MNLVFANVVGRCDGLVDALRAELGGILAERILDVEAADFLWEARVRERYLGEHVDAVPGDEELDLTQSRMAILSALDRRWYAGICLVDGEGMVLELLWKQEFDKIEETESAFDRAR